MTCFYCGQPHDFRDRCVNTTPREVWYESLLPAWLAINRSCGSSSSGGEE